jgi:hypothetical protein
MAGIKLGNVGAQYEVLSVLDYNLKRRVLASTSKGHHPHAESAT